MNTQRTQTQGGPPLGVLAIVFTALFVAGLVLSIVIAGGAVFPSPFGQEADSAAYFRDHQLAVRISAFFQFASAIPLAIYTATANARLHRLGIRAPGATIALAGGLLASVFMACSGLLTWVLSRPGVADEPVLVRLLQNLAFGTGGPGHVVPLGLLIAGISVPGLLAGLLPRWLSVAGLVIAGLAQLTTLALLVEGAAFLLPISRFTGLIWLVVAGFLLPLERERKTR
ncbi:DUF4386 domain-containing protein [Allokutzneria sp. A3M-2-11 16]|uniref:DUF4386 domain-containing protein n=1 Tax=Allokutzneria sp. A3M-2-11 16 TaxID=2962043 RepID=UPI0020B760C1|nr:DUF4386 domain-containing protein [Allokutzneria sp. A3M-2-11 16]MCP3803375.1 DUF4386 domain-containing protein [Allokutzneria sp. A3M-2-11 16]